MTLPWRGVRETAFLHSTPQVTCPICPGGLKMDTQCLGRAGSLAPPGLKWTRVSTVFNTPGEWPGVYPAPLFLLGHFHLRDKDNAATMARIFPGELPAGFTHS